MSCTRTPDIVLSVCFLILCVALRSPLLLVSRWLEASGGFVVDSMLLQNLFAGKVQVKGDVLGHYLLPVQNKKPDGVLDGDFYNGSLENCMGLKATFC